MRLSDLLSKNKIKEFYQVEGFLQRKVQVGQSRKLEVGKIALPYYCKTCNDDMSFTSNSDLYCVGVNDNQISIDCVLTCPRCGKELPVWFLVDSKENINAPLIKARVLKRTEKFPEDVSVAKSNYGDYSELLAKAECAYRNDLGAGAIVYLRKTFENITINVANAEHISLLTVNEKRRRFSEILEEVDSKRSIIPKEFSNNGYTLFSELSEVLHGARVTDEDALKKYESLQRLVVGIIDNVKNNSELMSAIGQLGWNTDIEG